MFPEPQPSGLSVTKPLELGFSGRVDPANRVESISTHEPETQNLGTRVNAPHQQQAQNPVYMPVDSPPYALTLNP